MNKTFQAVTQVAHVLGYSLLTVARADLVPVDGAPPKLAATFDGRTVMVAADLPSTVRLFLAVHALGHCQQWARNPASRDVDPSDLAWAMPTGRRVALAYAQEQDANEYGLSFLARVPLCPEIETVRQHMRDDWTLFAQYLGADMTTLPIMRMFDDGRFLVRAPSLPVRIAGAFDL